MIALVVAFGACACCLKPFALYVYNKYAPKTSAASPEGLSGKTADAAHVVLKSVCQRDTDVAETAIYQGITMTKVDGYHGAIVHTKGQRHIFQRKAKP